MAALSNYLENKLIDHVFRGIPFSAPSTGYLALFTSATTDAGGGIEVSGGGYARVAIPLSATNFSGTQAAGSTTASTGTSGKTSNNVAINFPLMPAASVTHFAIYDAAVGGNILIHSAMPDMVVVQAGGSARFPVGDLSVTFD